MREERDRKKGIRVQTSKLKIIENESEVKVKKRCSVNKICEFLMMKTRGSPHTFFCNSLFDV